MGQRFIVAFAGLALLAACGGEGPDKSSSHTSGGSKPPAGWNAVDACSVIDGAAYGSFVGKAVASTSVGLSRESDGTTAATSECTYEFSEGGRSSIMLRWSPINDNTEGAINEARNGLNATAKAFNGNVETVDGLGKAAYWVGLTNSLNVFISEDKFAIINVPASNTARDQAIAIAKKLGA